jgi:hypothetical protein
MVPILSQVRAARKSAGSLVVLAGTLAGLGLVSAALPVAAQAAAAATCPEATLVQPFLKWEDSGYYSLIAGGSFEAGEPAWTLSGGAKVASGSETFAVTGKLGKSSLGLPQGASAQSQVICVEPNDRTFRFFARAEGTSATVTVKVVYENSAKNKSVTLTRSGTVSSSWAPSPILETGVPASSMVSGGVADLSITVTATKGTARIDDVYLDPRMKR